MFYIQYLETLSAGKLLSALCESCTHTKDEVNNCSRTRLCVIASCNNTSSGSSKALNEPRRLTQLTSLLCSDCEKQQCFLRQANVDSAVSSRFPRQVAAPLINYPVNSDSTVFLLMLVCRR